MRESTPGGSATGSLPKTRTVPCSALSKPRMCLISVVFPAPFCPTKPNTVPFSNVRSTPASACFFPYVRVRPRTSITLSLMAHLLFVHRPKSRFAHSDHVDQLVKGHIQRAAFFDQPVDLLRQDRLLLGANGLQVGGGDEGTEAPAECHDTGAFE